LFIGAQLCGHRMQFRAILMMIFGANPSYRGFIKLNGVGFIPF